MDIAVTTRPVRPADRTLFYRLWPRFSPETGSTVTPDADVPTVTSPITPEPVSASARSDSLLATAPH